MDLPPVLRSLLNYQQFMINAILVDDEVPCLDTLSILLEEALP
jgi:hypothetical protein